MSLFHGAALEGRLGFGEADSRGVTATGWGSLLAAVVNEAAAGSTGVVGVMTVAAGCSSGNTLAAPGAGLGSATEEEVSALGSTTDDVDGVLGWISVGSLVEGLSDSGVVGEVLVLSIYSIEHSTGASRSKAVVAAGGEIIYNIAYV